MQRRSLGSSGLRVPVIGMGAWQLGGDAWGPVEDSAGEALVHRALERGCDFFDTAPGYGSGRSEEILGRALKGRRSEAQICTKFAYNAQGQRDFSPPALRWSLEQSLKRLQTDYVDILLLHNPGPEILDAGQPVWGALEQLKREGKLRAFGASLDSAAELKAAAERTPSQVVEVLYNAFFQEAAAAFALCRERGLGLFAKVPLDSGWLAGAYGASSTFSGVRSRWSPEVVKRRGALLERLRALLPAGLPLAAAALQFVLAEPAIACAIPGASKLSQLESNLAAAEAELPADCVEALKRLWREEIAPRPLPW